MAAEKPIQNLNAMATKYVGLTAILFFVPFAINNFIQQRFLLGALSAIVIGIILLNVWANFRHIYLNWVTLLIQVPVILFFLALAITQQGMIGVMWCGPAILSFSFMLSERQAWLANSILLLMTAILSWFVLEHSLAIRVVATLTATAIFSAIYVRIISAQQAKLKTMAITDPLTGLKNRLLLNSDLTQAIELSKRQQSSMALFALDLDHFKQINDNYGHDMGDQVLIAVSKVMKQRVRSSDYVFRLGGEEFCCLLSDVSEKHAIKVAEQIRQEVADLKIANIEKITLSIGIAMLKSDDDWQSWLKRADTLLYQAKLAGRNRLENTLNS